MSNLRECLHAKRRICLVSQSRDALAFERISCGADKDGGGASAIVLNRSCDGLRVEGLIRELEEVAVRVGCLGGYRCRGIFRRGGLTRNGKQAGRISGDALTACSNDCAQFTSSTLTASTPFEISPIAGPSVACDLRTASRTARISASSSWSASLSSFAGAGASTSSSSSSSAAF